MSSSSPKDFFSILPSKQAFWLGFATAILALGTLGFIVLGSHILKGGSFNLDSDDREIADNAVLPTDDGEGAIPAGAVPVVTADDHVLGNENAEVTIIEYSDFQCPFCSQFHPSLKQAMTEYGDKVRWVYRHFPLSFHPNAVPAANAAECAAEQGKFWEYADALFANQDGLGTEFYKATATKLGLNATQFNNCLTASKYQSKIDQQSQEGGAAGVSGTPGSFIIGKDGTAIPIRGALPYASVKAAIDDMLAT